MSGEFEFPNSEDTVMDALVERLEEILPDEKCDMHPLQRLALAKALITGHLVIIKSETKEIYVIQEDDENE